MIIFVALGGGDVILDGTKRGGRGKVIKGKAKKRRADKAYALL